MKVTVQQIVPGNIIEWIQLATFGLDLSDPEYVKEYVEISETEITIKSSIQQGLVLKVRGDFVVQYSDLLGGPVLIGGTINGLVFCIEGSDEPLAVADGFAIDVLEMLAAIKEWQETGEFDPVQAIFETYQFMYIGSEGDDVAIGGNLDDVAYGNGGNDVLIAGAGDDMVDGGEGNDVLVGGPGNDKLMGGPGNDTASFEDDTEGVHVNPQIAKGRGIGRDSLDGIENYVGGSGNDMLVGGPEDNVLVGNGGDDKLIGGPGDDKLSGGEGDDKLVGGAGNDMLDGGPGKDEMTGGAGRDMFMWVDGEDCIRDYKDGVDMIIMDDFGFADFAEVLSFASQVKSDVVIDLGNGDSLTIENFRLSNFDAGDVII